MVNSSIEPSFTQSASYNNLIIARVGSSSLKLIKSSPQYINWTKEINTIDIQPSLGNIHSKNTIGSKFFELSILEGLGNYFNKVELMDINLFINKHSFLIAPIKEICQRILVNFDHGARFSIELFGDMELNTIMITSFVNRNLDESTLFRDKLIEYLIEDKNDSFEYLNVVLIPNEL